MLAMVIILVVTIIGLLVYNLNINKKLQELNNVNQKVSEFNLNDSCCTKGLSSRLLTVFLHFYRLVFQIMFEPLLVYYYDVNYGKKDASCSN